MLFLLARWLTNDLETLAPPLRPEILAGNLADAGGGIGLHRLSPPDDFSPMRMNWFNRQKEAAETHDRHLVLGVKELPRPVDEGTFCYRFSDKVDVAVIGYLQLNNPDTKELKKVFRTGFDEIMAREKVAKAEVSRWLQSAELENMQPWAKELLVEVIEDWSSGAEGGS
jgi:hypothetical protein